MIFTKVTALTDVMLPASIGSAGVRSGVRVGNATVWGGV
jgi:hypothetical protein